MDAIMKLLGAIDWANLDYNAIVAWIVKIVEWITGILA